MGDSSQPYQRDEISLPKSKITVYPGPDLDEITMDKKFMITYNRFCYEGMNISNHVSWPIAIEMVTRGGRATHTTFAWRSRMFPILSSGVHADWYEIARFDRGFKIEGDETIYYPVKLAKEVKKLMSEKKVWKAHVEYEELYGSKGPGKGAGIEGQKSDAIRTDTKPGNGQKTKDGATKEHCKVM